MSWMEDVVKLSGSEIIAVDGKTHRRTHDRKRGVKALHMVSAWACGNGVVLGQVKTEEKSNEITAVPELLDKLELSGHDVHPFRMHGKKSLVPASLRPDPLSSPGLSPFRTYLDTPGPSASVRTPPSTGTDEL